MSHLEGSCLCGKVRFSTDAEPKVMANCHCSDCRKATGAAYATLMFVERDAVKIEGETKSFDHVSDRGTKMTKHFCPNCGSPMFTTSEGRPTMIGLRAGSLSDTSTFKPKVNVYLSSKIESTPLDPDMPGFDKMPG